MRQPLASVFALAAAALAEPELPGRVRSRLEQITQQVQWLADLVHQYLPTDQSPGAGVHMLDLARLAGEVADAERVVYPGELILARPHEPVLVYGGEVDIWRAVSNLLGNATRAAGPLGRVRVEVGYDRDMALLLIEDSGPGFGRIKPGAGLGLQVVARTVGLCAGRIEYDRSPLGGVAVRLWLPPAMEPASLSGAYLIAACHGGRPQMT